MTTTQVGVGISACALVAAGLGWWLTNLFLRPLQGIQELRRQTNEDLLLYGNVDRTFHDDDRAIARVALSKRAAALTAAAEATSLPVRCWISLRHGWDLRLAGTQLVALTKAIDFAVIANGQVVSRANFDHALGLPPKYPPVMVMKAYAEMRIAAPKWLKAEA